MAVASPPSAAFELKSAALTLVAVALKTADTGTLAAAFAERFADAPGLFDNDPVALDLSALRDQAAPIAFEAIVAMLRGHRMQPVAVRGGNAAQMEAALAAGLVEAQAPPVAPPRAVPAEPATASRSAGAGAASGAAGPGAVAAPSASSSAGSPSSSQGVPDTADPAPAGRPTMVVDRPLRSGQRVYAKGADLIVTGVVSFGAEVIADGHIHVYAPLRGRALAGAMGDTAARIFTTCMAPQLVSIAGIYRTTETELPDGVLGHAAQVRLDGEKLVVEPLRPD